LENKKIPLSLIAKRCKEIWDELTCGLYGTDLYRLPSGAEILDAGLYAAGSFEAGRLITELSQGGLARAALAMTELCGMSLPVITVETYSPACACLDMQMAFAVNGVMLSGPMRLFLEPLRFSYADAALRSAGDAMIAVIQPDAPVSEDWVKSLAEKAAVSPAQVRLVVVPMKSISGCTQICGRMNENTMLTLTRSLGYDPGRAQHLVGTCPVCPVFAKPIHGKVLLPDDFLHYLAEAFLTYRAREGEDLQLLSDGLCFRSASAYGKLFSDLLAEADGDFYKIPNISHINKLARVTVNDLFSGFVYHAGCTEPDFLAPFLSN